MNGLDQFVTSIVEQTIESLHERGLLILNESEEENATRMFDGKIWLTLEDLRKRVDSGRCRRSWRRIRRVSLTTR